MSENACSADPPLIFTTLSNWVTPTEDLAFPSGSSNTEAEGRKASRMDSETRVGRRPRHATRPAKTA